MVIPKRTIISLRDQPRAECRLREHANILYYLFPNTIILVQPDHAMVLTLWPTSTAEHLTLAGMLVPEEPTTERAIRYWRKNEEIFWTAIEEDLDMAERIQRTLESGANGYLQFGTFEHLAPKVHAAIARACESLKLRDGRHST